MEAGVERSPPSVWYEAPGPAIDVHKSRRWEDFPSRSGPRTNTEASQFIAGALGGVRSGQGARSFVSIQSRRAC